MEGPIGIVNPLMTKLGFPAGDTSSEPYVSVIATDSTDLFGGAEIQIRLALPSP